MSFLKRLAGRRGGATGHDAQEAVRGTDPCAHPGCASQEAAPCAYADRRRRPCGYSWCPDHQVLLQGRAFCRRHAGVMRAIAANPEEPIEPPDLDNRALSLCEWVAADVDEDIQNLLRELQASHEAGVITTGALRLIVHRNPPIRVWARGWSIADHRGDQRRVGIEVSEANDSEVIATVDGNAVGRQVPPWITDRGTPISEEAVAKRRAEFRQSLVAAIYEAAVRAELSTKYE